MSDKPYISRYESRSSSKTVAPIRFRVWMLSLLVLAGLVLSGPLGFGQEPQEKDGKDRLAGFTFGPLPTFDLVFSGGSMEEYVLALREIMPDANIVIDSGAEDLQVPAMKLYSVDISRAINILDGLEYADAEGEIRVRVVAVPAVKNSTNYTGPAGNPLFRVIIESRYNRPPAQSSMILSISDLLGDPYSADDVMTAMETALSVVTDGTARLEPAVLRFHDTTGLLIARGTGEQLSAVNSVVNQLREGLDRSRATSMHDSDNQIDHLRSTLEQSQKAVAERDDMLRGQMMELERSKARLEAVTAELDRLTARIREIEAQRDDYRARVMILEQGQKKDPDRE